MKSKLHLICFFLAAHLQVYSQTESVNFSADITSGYGHVTVTFTNTSVGTFDYFLWSTYGKVQSMNNNGSFVCTYTRPGTFAVYLSSKSSTTGQSYYVPKYKYIKVYATQLPAYELTANEITVDANGYITTCKVSNLNAVAYNEGNIKIPSTINGQTIKGIADDETGVFFDRQIVKLSLPNTIEYIGKRAFQMNYIQGVTIPNGVKIIGVESFNNNDIRSVNIPPSVERIEDYAFAQQHGIGNTPMEGSGTDGGFVSSIAIRFVDSNGNQDIKSSYLKYMGDGAFANAGARGNNTGLIEDDGVVSTQTGLFIPPSVEEIGQSVFMDNRLTNVAFTDGSASCPKSNLKILRESAFNNYYQNGTVGSTVIIPASIERIEKRALYMLVTYTSYPSPNFGDIKFEDNSSLYFLDEEAYGDYLSIGSTTMPTQKAASNTPGLWVNMKTGKFIAPEADGTYTLTNKDKRVWKAAYIVGFVDFDGTKITADTVLHGGTATPPPDPARSGYTFSAWDVKLDSVVQYMTATAQYTQNGTTNYTVTFKDWDGTVLKTEIVAHGQPATAPSNPNRTGYTFIGWDNAFTNVAAELTITAQYDINKYTVTFKDWDGTILKTESVEYEKSATVPSDPVRSGYTFSSWDMDFSKVTKDLIVTAQYTQNGATNYTVTFKDWDGTVLKTEIVAHGQPATAPSNPNRTGYTFIGWDNAFTNVAAELTITAQYDINKYTVTFKDWDGAILKTESVEYEKSATAPANPTRMGYTFAGWDNTFANVTTDLAITAQYNINEYTVTFKDWDGTILKTESVEYGKSATAPEHPIRQGYIFIGWSTGFTKIVSDIIVSAQYSIITAMEEKVEDEFLKVYPNPVKDYLFIEIDNAGLSKITGTGITITNNMGEVIFHLKDVKTRQLVNIEKLPTGIYFLSTQEWSRKIIKE